MCFDFDNKFDVFEVKAESTELVPELEEDIKKTLRRLHKIRGDDDFQILTYASVMQTVTSITGLITAFLAGRNRL